MKRSTSNVLFKYCKRNLSCSNQELGTGSWADWRQWCCCGCSHTQGRQQGCGIWGDAAGRGWGCGTVPTQLLPWQCPWGAWRHKSTGAWGDTAAAALCAATPGLCSLPRPLTPGAGSTEHLQRHRAAWFPAHFPLARLPLSQSQGSAPWDSPSARNNFWLEEILVGH